jgi:hydroxymethylglutaryl-CoA lyase
VVHCPFDGPVEPAAVVRVAARLMDMGCDEVSLGDTIGRAAPQETRAMLEAVLADIPPERLAGHFHDTSGQALANVEAALDLGLRVFDASVAGLGGCPYAPGAAGNLATGALIERLDALGLSHGVDSGALARAEKIVSAMRSAT